MYLITDIAGPDGRGNVSMTAQDPLCLVGFGKAQIPKPTSAILYADITDSQNQHNALSPDTVDGRVMDLSDYPSTYLYIRIGENLIMERAAVPLGGQGLNTRAHFVQQRSARGGRCCSGYNGGTPPVQQLKNGFKQRRHCRQFLDLTQWGSV